MLNALLAISKHLIPKKKSTLTGLWQWKAKENSQHTPKQKSKKGRNPTTITQLGNRTHSVTQGGKHKSFLYISKRINVRVRMRTE